MKTRQFTAIILVAAAIPLQLAAQGTFKGLGVPFTYLSSISGDGKVVVGLLGAYGPAFRWTAETGVVDIGGNGTTTAVSRDGSVIVSAAPNAQGISDAAIWMSGKQWKILGDLGGPASGANNNVSQAYSVCNNNGYTVVVGLSFVPSGKAHAFRWDNVSGMVDLGSLQGKSSRANGISADCGTIVGWDDNSYPHNFDPWRGAMWWQGIERLIHPFGWIGQAYAANVSGTAIVGRGLPTSDPNVFAHGYLWTAWGQLVDLGALKRGLTQNQQALENVSYAFALSDDASVVVGSSGWEPPTDAFIWTPATNIVKLSDYLIGKGITGLDGWTLMVANSITPDGKMIGGVGISPSNQIEGWIATLP